jgi:protein-tyrosine phosphatase
VGSRYKTSKEAIAKMKQILFLCTGNYYRSRFAEYFFNSLASKQGLDWQADSRALAIERGVNNIGAMSKYAVEALAIRGISVPEEERFPQGVQNGDFQTADIVIALDQSEHLPLIRERFPQWMNTIEYWLVHDIDQTSATEALGQIEKHILHLAEKLANNYTK